MERMIGSLIIIAALGGAAGVLSAQARDGEPVTTRELVNEIRALRMAIERYAEAQAQTQTIGSLITVQQQRVAEASTRLDVVRRELDATTIRYNDVARRLAAAEQMTPGDMIGPGGTPPIDRRQALEEHRSQLRIEFESVSGQLAQLRARESETLNQVAFEEGRWRELAGRMEQMLKR
jgi:chromosome segregation ATPase